MELRYIPTHINPSGELTKSETLHMELDQTVKEIIKSDNEKLIQKFRELFQELTIQCIEDNYFWQYCPAEVYRNTFNVRMAHYLQIFPDAKPFDFNNLEMGHIRKYTNYFRYFFIENAQENLSYHFDPKINKTHSWKFNATIDIVAQQKITYSVSRKLEFLKGITVPSDNKEREEEIFLDYSDNTDAEKIVMLYLLDILDFLIEKFPHGLSTNKLAEIASSFTGIRQTTAQSALNPIFSQQADQKNNPLTPKNLKTAREKLIKMGFNTDKSA